MGTQARTPLSFRLAALALATGGFWYRTSMTASNAAPPDLELLRAWSEGDERAGNELVERHFDSIYRFFSGRLTSEADVTDLAQKTFLACLERRERWDGVERFKPYLLGIARNQLLMHLRYSNVRRGEVAVGSIQQRLAESAAPRISKVAADRQQQRALLVALRRLPEDLQTTLELHYWEGLTTREVGDVLGVSGGAVKTRLFRARQLLSESLASLQGTGEVAEATLRDLGDWVANLRERRPLGSIE